MAKVSEKSTLAAATLAQDTDFIYVVDTSAGAGYKMTPTAFLTDRTFAGTLTWAGLTGANKVAVPDNLADAWSVKEGSNFVLTVCTTDAAELVNFTYNVSLINATTPTLTLETGKTNTGAVIIKGKTSGQLKFTTADATAQTVTVTAAAQTSGASTWTLPDAAGVAQSFVTLALTQELTNKTLTAQVVKTGLTASGAAANDFSASTGTFLTSTGTNTLGGNTLFKLIATPVAATGAAGGVAGAAALGAGNFLTVSSDGATKGVKLLTGAAGDVKWVINTSSTACNLFAASGGTINGGSADAGCAIPASKGVLCICTATNAWSVYDFTAKAGAAA